MLRSRQLEIIVILCTMLGINSLVKAQGISRIGNSPYPLSVTPDTLYMVHIDGMTQTQQLTVVTLQGLIARTKPKIMVDRGSADYINDLTKRYGVTYDSTYFNNFGGLMGHFKNAVSGYILCKLSDSSTDAAISICAMLNGIAANIADTAMLDSIGIHFLFDARNKGEIWSFDTFQSLYSKRVITIQDPAKSSFITDYDVFAGAYDFFNFPFFPAPKAAFASMDINSAVFGWFGGEQQFVSTTSAYGLHVHASDFSNNLSVYSNFSIPQQHQINHTNDTVLRPGVHTVCFVMTDGDNLQWLGGGFPNLSNWYGNVHRGEINLGWTISPALAEVAPTQMKYIYDTAATTPNGRDGFIAAPSGMGYSYPDVFSIPDSGAAITSRMMQKADLHILNVIAGNYSAASLAPYLAEPNIDAVFYYPYSNGYIDNGFTDCINGKPVIGGRFNLWSQFYSTYTLAQAVNAMPKNPYSPDGYSLIPVNVWSSTVDSVILCAGMLDSNVRIVTPETFVKLYMAGNNCVPNGIADIKNTSTISLYSQPNPANGQMQIVYTLPAATHIEATLYDSYGREAKQLFTNEAAAGTHRFDADISSLAAGLYYYTLRGGYFTETRKCIIAR